MPDIFDNGVPSAGACWLNVLLLAHQRVCPAISGLRQHVVKDAEA